MVQEVSQFLMLLGLYAEQLHKVINRILINFSTTWAWPKKDRGPSGQGNWGKVREFEWPGKVRGKYFFWKSQGK